MVKRREWHQSVDLWIATKRMLMVVAAAVAVVVQEESEEKGSVNWKKEELTRASPRSSGAQKTPSRQGERGGKCDKKCQKKNRNNLAPHRQFDNLAFHKQRWIDDQ